MAIILIVDDDKTFLLSLVEGLKAHDQEFEIRTAANGRIATQILKDESVDLIITDLKMPVMDGFELLAYMSSHHPRIPVIVMTAYGTPVIENSVSHLGAIRYLEKPVDFDLLVDNIYNIVKPFDDLDVPGIQLTSFLKLLQMEKKTCVLTIHNQDQKGKMFLKKGVLIHAIAPNSSGETAVMEILGWGQSEIQISSKTFSVEKNIQHDLDFIMMVLESRQRSIRASEPVQTSSASTYDIELGNIFNVGEEVGTTALSGDVPAATTDTLSLSDLGKEKSLSALREASEGDQTIVPTMEESAFEPDGALTEENPILEVEIAIAETEGKECFADEAANDESFTESAEDMIDKDRPETENRVSDEISAPIDALPEEPADFNLLNKDEQWPEENHASEEASGEEPTANDRHMTDAKEECTEETPAPIAAAPEEPAAQIMLTAEDEMLEEIPATIEESSAEFIDKDVLSTENQLPEENPVAAIEEPLDTQSVPKEEDTQLPISQTGEEKLTNLLEGKENAVNVKKMNEALNTLKETAGAGLISCDIYTTRDGQSIISYNGNETYCAMSNQITQYMINTIKEAGFPPMGNTYMVDLADDKMVIVLILGDYQWGILIDTKKTSLGILLNVALPKAKAVFAAALEN